MRLHPGLAGLLVLPLTVLAAPAPAVDTKPAAASQITWKKTVIDTAFRSEGVAIADVNRDGKMDILVGDAWFEAPDWKAHKIRAGKDDYREGDKNVYSNCMCCWAADLNGDGYPDQIVVGFPGQPCHWYENPKGKDELWKEHVIWHSACNETPQYVDLFGTGKRVLIVGSQPKEKDADGKAKENEGQMIWLTPGKDPTEPWEAHPISEPSAPNKVVPGTFRFSHGLGVGDVNGDGRLDVICTGGWWEQPEGAATSTTPWKFHPADLGPDCSDMFALDLDGDGKADILSCSAHQYGIWSHLQKPAKDGHPEFLRQDLFPQLVSQTHAAHLVDINGDGLKDLVTGKRYWAHGPHGDAEPDKPAMLYWFEAKKDRDGVITFIPHEIDKDSGVGTQFVVADFNGDGLMDIVISNKKGVFVFEQVRK